MQSTKIVRCRPQSTFLAKKLSFFEVPVFTVGGRLGGKDTLPASRLCGKCAAINVLVANGLHGGSQAALEVIYVA